MISRQQLVTFVHNRIDSMASRSRMWAGTQESFIVQLVLLVEFSYVQREEWTSDKLMSELCGKDTNAVPDGPVTAAWARTACDIARKHVRQSVW